MRLFSKHYLIEFLLVFLRCLLSQFQLLCRICLQVDISNLATSCCRLFEHLRCRHNLDEFKILDNNRFVLKQIMLIVVLQIVPLNSFLKLLLIVKLVKKCHGSIPVQNVISLVVNLKLLCNCGFEPAMLKSNTLKRLQINGFLDKWLSFIIIDRFLVLLYFL